MYTPILKLRANLYRLLARVQRGIVIEVTSLRRLIAHVAGIPGASTPVLGRMLHHGSISWNGSKPEPRRNLPKLTTEGVPVSSMVLADRD